MIEMKYSIDVYRDGRWWMVEVPELDLITQARRVGEVREQAVSLIAMSLDVAPSEVEIDIRSVKVGEVDALGIAEHVQAARTEAQEAEAKAAAAMSEAARTLAALAPVRDVGELLGVSHQRVSQIVH